MLSRGLPKGWVLVVLLNRGWNSGGKDSSSQRPRPAARFSRGAQRGINPAVAVPVVPVAADSVTPPTFGLRVAVLSRRHPGQDHFAGLNSEALAGKVLLIKDPGHFAIDSGRLYVVTAAVVGDREGFEGEVFSVTLARESVRAAKFLIAGEPAEYRCSGRHRGIGTDGPEAFTGDEPVADRFSDLNVIAGRTAVLGRVLVVASEVGSTPLLLQQFIDSLLAKGTIIRTKRGVYALPGTAPVYVTTSDAIMSGLTKKPMKMDALVRHVNRLTKSASPRAMIHRVLLRLKEQGTVKQDRRGGEYRLVRRACAVRGQVGQRRRS